MSYIDTAIINDGEKVIVWEKNENGEVVSKLYDAEYYYYLPKSNGEQKTIFKDRFTHAKKIVCKNQKELKEAARSHYKNDPTIPLFESDIPPDLRIICDKYYKKEIPQLNVTFFDIETDADLKNKGWARVGNPYGEVISVALYHQWKNEIVVIAIPPKEFTGKLFTAEELQCNRVIYADTELDLIYNFLIEIQDANLLSGWNCVNLNGNIWKTDRIIELRDLKANDTISNGSVVIDTYDSGEKLENIITLLNGTKISISDEHIIPVYSKQKHQYKYPSTLLSSRKELRVDDIKKEDGDLYLEYMKHDNINCDITYRDFILENLDDLLCTKKFDLVITSPSIRDIILEKINPADYFSYDQYYKSDTFYDKCPNKWLVSDWISNGTITIDVVIDMIKTSNIIRAKTFNSHTFDVDISKPISEDHLQLLGLIFTDGHYSNYDSSYSISNTNAGIHNGYLPIIKKLSKKDKKWKLSKDGCSYITLSGNNELGLLYSLIYKDDTKRLDLTNLSRLSTKQFAAFTSGIIDGDGGLHGKNPTIVICNFENQVDTLHKLFQWNGVFSIASKNTIRIPTIEYNSSFYDQLNLYHDKKLMLKTSSKFKHKVNSPNKKLAYFEYDDKFIIKIKSIEVTNNFVPMGDITTSSHYFTYNGITVHNCDKYDIPYMIERMKLLLVSDSVTENDVLALMCLDGIPAKKKEIPSKFGNKTEIVYKLYGRINIDYMDLYEKFTFEELQSYSLESVATKELEYGKVEYKGTLPELYRNDFKTFLEYNRHDATLLRDLDAKLGFIRLLNIMAHDCSCRLPDVLGTVIMTDQALIARAHHHRNEIVPDKGADVGIPDYISTAAREGAANDKYAGAFVYDMDEWDENNKVISTRRGLCGYVGSVDITSLYPNAMISNNISIETIIWNAARSKGDVLWADRMNYYRDKVHQFEKDQVNDDTRNDSEMRGIRLERTVILDMAERTKDWSKVELLESYKWGARNDFVGLVPEILSYWFDERLKLKKQLKEVSKKRNAILDKYGIDTKKPPKPEKIKELMPEDSFNDYMHWRAETENFDRLQHIKKIQLNSLYGAVGNAYSHFYNLACAEACTLAGQGIAQHMIKNVAYILDGVLDMRSESIQYADTDSVAHDTVIKTDIGNYTIDELYSMCGSKWNDNDKEYGNSDKFKILSYDDTTKSAEFMNFNYIYRHKVSKDRWVIESESGNIITVTNDHSCMVMRDNKLIEVKARDILLSDELIEVIE